MFNNAQLDKMIIFVLIAIIAILVIAVLALSIKRNIYYVDENGNEIKPNKKKPGQMSAPRPAAPAPQTVTPMPVEPQTPLEVKGTAVKGALVAVTINGEKTESTITTFPCLMGRESSSCDLVISEPAVSRRHAQIIEDNGSLYLEDVSEHNGTYLNGTKLPPLGRARIHELDRISLGRAEIDILKLMY